MAEYIDKEKLLQKLSRMIDYCENDNKVTGLTSLFQVVAAIMDCPNADVVEVVRCKDCKFRGTDNCSNSYYSEYEGAYVDPMDDDNFCSYGERRKENISKTY